MKKSIFKGICFVLLTMITTNGMAQYDHLSKEQKEQKSIELINEAECFILGAPINSESFYGDDGKTIYTKINIRVKHWYKGKGSRVISMVRMGGIIGSDNQIISHRQGPSMRIDIDQFMLLTKAKDGNYEYVDINSKASSGRYSDTRYDDFEIIAFYGMKFSSYDSFNDFIKDIKDIKVLNKKKDVGFQEDISKEFAMTINESWLQSLGPLHAGTGEILTIKGSNFGNNGNVLFMNAENPGERLPGLDNIYIVDWTPTEIKVLIPSIVTEGFVNNELGTAASGTILIKRKFLFFTLQEESDTKLNIKYAVRNRATSPVNGVRPQYYLAREHCLNGFVFTLHTSFIGNDVAINILETALSSWANELGITLKIERQQDGSYYFHDELPPAKAPGTRMARRNLIWFDPLLNQTVINGQPNPYYDRPMVTHASGFTDVSAPTPGNWAAYSNIRINPAKEWNYSTSGNIDYGVNLDFYEIILHELGHALGLRHDIKYTAYTSTGTIDNKNLMHPTTQGAGTATSNQRINLSQHSDRAKAGAQRIVSDSRTRNWSTSFTDVHGIDALAASGVNSLVLPAPEIKMTLNGPVTYPVLDQGTTAKLEPEPFNDSYDYYWNPQDIVANSLNVVPVCIKNTYYVRLKDAACTVSSVYSLPEEFPLSNCPRVSDHRDDEGLLLAYPNPTTGQLNVEFGKTEEKSIDQPDTYIGIYDNLGRLQHQHKVSDATLRQTTIDISTLPAGMYWVVWFADGEVIDTQQLQKTD